MPRIVYLLLSNGGIAGGHKVILRHAEALSDLGFDAACYIGVESKTPTWLAHHAPLEIATPLRPDDILVIPDDAPEALTTCMNAGLRTLMISQNPYNFAAQTFDILDRFPAGRFPEILAVAPGLADLIRRCFPQARVHVVPCFADERIFRPGDDATRRSEVMLSPRKRPQEAVVIRQFLRRMHPRHAGLGWRAVTQLAEPEMAAAMAGASLHLSLSRLESVGMTPLEAMACGCVCAGFTGVGGREFATGDNGFWAPDDDCEAAADALAQAADLVATGGPALARMIEAGRATAEAWSYARFRARLEEAWMDLAPESRVRSGPPA